jgi:indolepyruvate ferredoxin oxidoreductase alpha subunit
MRSDVTIGPIEKPERKAEFDWDGFSYRVAGFERLFRRHRERHGKLDRAQEEFEGLKYNKLKLEGGEKLGVIGVGFSFSYVIDAIRKLGVESDVAFLKLATPHPLPVKLVDGLLGGVERVLVVEEVDPFVELHVKALAKDMSPDVKVIGRMSGHLSREGELSPVILDNALADLLCVKAEEADRSGVEAKVKELLFDRMLTLCAGCPHRASIYALKQAVKEVKGDLRAAMGSPTPRR